MTACDQTYLSSPQTTILHLLRPLLFRSWQTTDGRYKSLIDSSLVYLLWYESLID